MVDSLLRQGAALRAMTRNPESSKAKSLVKRGVEVVQGGLAVKASLVGVHSTHPPSPHPSHAIPMRAVHGWSKCGCACMAALRCIPCCLAMTRLPLGLNTGHEAGAYRILCD